jgi:proline dehydrogenase
MIKPFKNIISNIPIYSRFIAGTHLNSALYVSHKLKKNNIGTIFDFSVESPKKLNRNIDEIFKQITKIDSSFIALKFSSLGIDDVNNCKHLIKQFYDENKKKENPNQFLIDAEYNSIQKEIYELSDYAIDNYNTINNKYFYKTLQMYRNDVWDIYNNDINNFMKNNKYALKLVRGAYISTDSKYILTSKDYTDIQYNNAINEYFFNLIKYPENKLIIATHNKNSYTLAKKQLNIINTDNIYFATLLGMGNEICYDNTKNKLKYVPYGPFLETVPYLVRRLIENKDILKHVNL